MSSSIILHNTLITVHNGGILSAAAPQKALYTAHLVEDIGELTDTITTKEDINSWNVGDVILFAPSVQIVEDISVKIKGVIKNITSPTTFILVEPVASYILSSIPATVPHIINLTQEFKISGASDDKRGAMRVLDAGRINLNNIEFNHWGIPSVDSKNGIILLTDKTHNNIISSCTLNNDAEPDTRFVTIYQDGIRLSSSNLIFQDNIVYNSGGDSVVCDFNTPLSSNLILNNNIYYDGSIYISNLSSDYLSAQDCIYMGNTKVKYALDIDCKYITDFIYKDTTVYSNTSGARFYQLSSSTVKELTATYNNTVGLFIDYPVDVIVDGISATNNFGIGIHIQDPLRGLTIQNTTANYNTNNNIHIYSGTGDRYDNKITIKDSSVTDSKNSGVYYYGAGPLLLSQLTANNNINNGISVDFIRLGVSYNSLTTSNCWISGCTDGVHVKTETASFLTPDVITIADNNFGNNICGVSATNITGTLSGNNFTNNLIDMNISIGNKYTHFNQNTSISLLSSSDHTHLSIHGGVNYAGISITNNTVQNDVTLIKGGLNAIKYAEGSIVSSWPIGGIPLVLQRETLALPLIDTEGILFYYTDTDIRYFKIFYSGETYSSKQWKVAVYKNDTVIKYIPKGASVKIELPPESTTTQLYNKFLILLEKDSLDRNTVSVNITKIQYSYDDITYTDIQLANLYYRSDIAYPANTNPASIISQCGIKNTYNNLIRLYHTNFKNFNVSHTVCSTYLYNKFQLMQGVVQGSYITKDSNIVVDSVDVSKFYQNRTEKMTGIVSVVGEEVSSYFKNGYILRNNNNKFIQINDQNNAPSEVLYPKTDASNKLISGKKYVAINAYEQSTIYTYVKISTNYNGSSPRLILSRNAGIGILNDVVIATHTEIPGMWQLLKGVTPDVTQDGVLEFYIECDGTAGYVAIDSWAAPAKNITGTTAVTTHTIE